MPRVLHLIKSLGRGGAEVLLSEGLAVANRGTFEYSYGYFLPWKDAMVESLEQQEAMVHCFNRRNNLQILRSVKQVAGLVQDAKIDVVHAHLPIAGVVARLACKRTNTPVVYTEHNLQHRYHFATRFLNSRTWHLQRKAIAVSEEVAKSIEQTVGSQIETQTILNGVNTSFYSPGFQSVQNIKESLGIPRNSFIVGTIAVFRSSKRLEDWIKVAEVVSTKCPSTHFLLVGGGPEMDKISSIVNESKARSRITLAGFQSNTREYFAVMDAYLMTSEREGLPIALLEAMSMGLPPVSTSVGGIPELVVDHESGFLLPFGNVDGLAYAVARLVENPSLRESMGLAARNRVVEHFSMQRMQADLERIYVEVLSE